MFWIGFGAGVIAATGAFVALVVWSAFRMNRDEEQEDDTENEINFTKNQKF